ncbi:hypothetical protein [Burkholderia seminalis]|uniref:hypothetical protein n=1 Tax=Burkholderia seminalis TaxID=488731 RepID=UPI001903258F|nr:hypothetical protein [Burkholderia seminalis]MBJ9593686.1 hypothetical protein [Burkholderia seminalis]
MAGMITFERKALYDEVWTDPVSVVTKRYGLSDHALRKICRELAVPTPSSGYWSVLRLGKVKPERAALPSFDGPETYTYVPMPGADARHFVGHMDARRVRQEESAPENRIVPDTDGPFKDPYVKTVSKYLDTAIKHLEVRKRPGWRPKTSGDWMHVHVTHSGCIDPEHQYLRIIVTPAMRRRAECVADAFMCAVRERGFSVRAEKKGVEISCGDVVMRVRLTELERRDKLPDGERWVPLGQLRLSLRRSRYENGIPDGISITDEPGNPIEGQLNDIVAKLRILVLGADGREEQRQSDAIKREEQRVKFEAEMRERQRKAEEAKQEAARVEAFFAEADRWSAIDRRRQYLSRVEQAARNLHADLSDGSPLHSWLAWAHAVCDAHDPLCTRLPDIKQ